MIVSSDSCTWRKCRSRSRTALTSFTGTLTRPKLKEPVQSDLAKARLQRRREIVRLLLGLGLGRVDVLALALALDHREHGVAIGVLVFARLELRLERVDQLLGHVEFPL